VVAVLQWSIPGSVLGLVGLWVFELVRRRRRGGSGTPVSAAYVDEFTAAFYGTKRIELDHRESVSMMREEREQGAPPRMGVDLDAGVVVVRPDAQP
jgi:hypothetical protein